MAQARFGRIFPAMLADPDLTAADLKVLAAVMVFADINGRAFPKVDTLAEMTNYKRRNVLKRMSHLEEIGWIARTGNGGRSRPAQYQVNMERAKNGAQMDTLSEINGAQMDTLISVKGARLDTKGCTDGHPHRTDHKQTNNPPLNKDDDEDSFCLDLLKEVITEEFNAKLPRLQTAQAETWAGLREQHLEKVVQEYPKAQEPDWWGNYFANLARASDYHEWAGGTGKPPVNLGYFIHPTNFMRFVEMAKFIQERTSKTGPTS